METQKIPNSQSNLEKEKQLEESGSLTSDTKVCILQSYSHQNSLLLAQK